MSAPERNQQRGWAHWLGRGVLWLTGAGIGAFLGILAAVVGQSELPILVVLGLLGLLGIFLAVGVSSWPLAARDFVAGVGIGDLAGTGFVLSVLNSLPSC